MTFFLEGTKLVAVQAEGPIAEFAEVSDDGEMVWAPYWNPSMRRADLGERCPWRRPASSRADSQQTVCFAGRGRRYFLEGPELGSNVGGTQLQEAARPRRVHAASRARRLALAATVAVALVPGALAGASGSAEGEGAGGTTAARSQPPTAAQVAAWEASFLASHEQAPKAAPLAKGNAPGGRLFPQNKILSLYGAAGGFGILGRKSLDGAARKLRDQVRPYARRTDEKVVKAFDLVAVVATTCSGPRDRCRTRVSGDTLRRYHEKIRNMNGRLILDIQPGRADVLDEIDHLRNFIQKPDVDVAIDAEWNVGPRGEPGEDLGSIGARKINRAAKMIERIIVNHDLPPKALIVHQFREDSVKGERSIERPGRVDITLNFDGIGSPSAKRSGYRDLSFKGLFNGFSLFYELDQNLMSPRQVLGLRPEPDYVMYQ
ncbi:MAG: hypothetical protein ACR2G3_07340 [Solirubrobacterales bacterium]